MNNTNLNKQKVVIGSTKKNVEKDIPNFFKLIDKISSLYSDYFIICVGYV